MTTGSTEELNLLLSRVAISLIRKIPRQMFEIFRESDADTLKLSQNVEYLNSFLRSHGCMNVNEGELTEAYWQAKKEYELCAKHSIDILTTWDVEYPQRLLETSDYPLLLFRYGDCDLNDGDMLAIVGTRKCTSYGTSFVSKTVKELTPLSGRLVIVSGLAFGVDASAHTAALEAHTPTVAVLAHGYGTLYPAQHRDLAQHIREQGGCLVTEYLWGERPYRQYFLERNRIVAGLSDGILIAESAIKGGAMSTANIAFSIGRPVMALPGRIGDEASGGCNLLIAQQKAQLVVSPADIAHTIGMDLQRSAPLPIIPKLFSEPQGEEKRIYEVVASRREPIQLDELCSILQMPASRLSALLGEMEFDGIVTRLPGNRFTIY